MAAPTFSSEDEEERLAIEIGRRETEVLRRVVAAGGDMAAVEVVLVEELLRPPRDRFFLQVLFRPAGDLMEYMQDAMEPEQRVTILTLFNLIMYGAETYATHFLEMTSTDLASQENPVTKGKIIKMRAVSAAAILKYGRAALTEGTKNRLEGALSASKNSSAPAAGGRRMSRKYCKKTPCRKMGFTQKASCRPYKNCFTRKARR